MIVSFGIELIAISWIKKKKFFIVLWVYSLLSIVYTDYRTYSNLFILYSNLL